MEQWHKSTTKKRHDQYTQWQHQSFAPFAVPATTTAAAAATTTAAIL
jgi:hypothetical protein